MAEDPPEIGLEEADFSNENTSDSSLPEDVRTYDRFSKIDRASYDRVNKFLRDRTYITAREWAIARLCAGFITANQLDDLMYESTEVAKFLLEVESIDLSLNEELDAEDRISSIMRDVRRAAIKLRYEDNHCPECGQPLHEDSTK